MSRGAAALLLAMPLAVAANPPLSDEPLEPERAFRLSASPMASGGGRAIIALRFEIEDGYYLYASRFRVDAGNLPVGALVVPPGTEKDDPFVGRVRILRRSAVLHLPLDGSASPGTYRLRVTAQGCAEERVCYAPFTQTVAVRWPG